MIYLNMNNGCCMCDNEELLCYLLKVKIDQFYNDMNYLCLKVYLESSLISKPIFWLGAYGNLLLL